MQTAIGRRPGNTSKAGLEHDIGTSRALTGELSCNFKSFSSKSDLQQRTGPTKENALLRAELELLRGQNADLAARLQLAEGRLGQHSRLLLHSRSSSGHQQELTSQRGALQDAAAQQAGVQACVRARLQEVLLQPEEAEAAALQCAWLSHHWELADHFGLYPEVAGSRAAYWRQLASPASAIVESAQHVCTALQELKEQALHGDASSSSSSSSFTTRPEWLLKSAKSGTFSTSLHATAADLVGVERGARQLQELGVEAAVLAALSQQAAARRTMLQLPPASRDGKVLPLMFGLLSPEEAAELQLQQAYLAFLWGRAALMGVEPQAKQWCCRMGGQPTARDFQDVRQGFQELRMLSIEQQMWQTQHVGGMQLPLPASFNAEDHLGSSVAATAAAPAKSFMAAAAAAPAAAAAGLLA
ncbi:hypothetical protein COO60DRAFT_1644014 [Scenedesmus sp. NREL 46B-D3]|nr:hypothetical protein COO60DRAFT_1644014 [Scenedesmus sp. NREL 46B-D3]